jgi:hypothetical protein
MKYIFVAGAPGSKWSSVVKNIYYSPSIDSSDFRDEWTYWHDATGKMALMHLGAYFDPGMECSLPEDLESLTREQLEQIFDYPFQKNDNGIRIIKSHIFSEHIPFLRKLFPETPIVLVRRSDDSCLGWWVKCGHFNITYPDYKDYFKDFKHMAQLIKRQNAAILEAMDTMKPHQVYNNSRLALLLGLEQPPAEYKQSYIDSDIEVKVLL